MTNNPLGGSGTYPRPTFEPCTGDTLPFSRKWISVHNIIITTACPVRIGYMEHIRSRPFLQVNSLGMFERDSLAISQPNLRKGLL